jgi:hypothetical protein
MRRFIDNISQIYVYKDAVDMRKSYDGLFKLVKNSELWNGGVFLFFSKNRKRAKALLWNEKGLMLIMQRMEHGRFADISRRESLTREEFLSFFEGSQIISKYDKQERFVVEKMDENCYKNRVGIDLNCKQEQTPDAYLFQR